MNLNNSWLSQNLKKKRERLGELLTYGWWDSVCNVKIVDTEIARSIYMYLIPQMADVGVIHLKYIDVNMVRTMSACW